MHITRSFGHWAIELFWVEKKIDVRFDLQLHLMLILL